MALLTGPKCLYCGTPGPIDSDRCDSCRDRRLFFSFARGAALYEGPVRGLVNALKFKRIESAAAPLGDLVCEYISRTQEIPLDALVVPVPVAGMRRLRRGFNQAELIARRMGKKLGLNCADVLRRVGGAKSQVGLGRGARLSNPAGSVRLVGPRKISSRTVLLVDDVLTTCATAGECARILIEGGAFRVIALAPARQV
jgi:ComF family protein